MDEGLSSIPPELGKEDKAGMTSPLSSKFEVKFLQNHPSQASKTAAEPSSIFEQGKEKASIFRSLPPAGTTTDVDDAVKGFFYPSQALKIVEGPSSIFQQGKENASSFCSLPSAGTTSGVDAAAKGFFYPSRALKTAEEPSNIFQQGKEKAGTTSDVDDAVKGFFYPSQASKCAAEQSSVFEQGNERASIFDSVPPLVTAADVKAKLLEKLSIEAPKAVTGLSSVPQRREFKSDEEYLEELIKFACRPLQKFYGIALDTDMKKMKRGRCKYDFFKEEAISFLEGIGGSLWAEKFVAQHEEVAGNVFLCRLLEDELIIVKGKSEVLGVRPVCQDNCFKGPYFEPDPSPPPRQFGFWRRDPFESFQAC